MSAKIGASGQIVKMIERLTYVLGSSASIYGVRGASAWDFLVMMP